MQTVIPTNDRVVRFQKKFFTEFIRTNKYSKLIGSTEKAAIQMVEDLEKGKGDQVYIYLVNDINPTVANGGIRTGYQTLKGYETQMDIRSNKLTIGLSRFAVSIFESDKQFSAIDLVEARQSVLQTKFKVYFRDRIIDAMGSMSVNGNDHVNYAVADEVTVKDVWLANNSDRVLFGNGVGSYADHSADITQLDTTNDIVNETNLKLWKDMAKAANPIIPPIRVNDDEEWYVVYLPTKLFRQAQTSLATLNREAWIRAKGDSNPLFTGGDLIGDGLIIKEDPSIQPLAGTPGASGTTKVAPGYLLGAQALGYATALRSKVITDTDDYGEVNGAGIKMLDQVAKLYFGAGASDTTSPKQNGIVTGYFAFA